MIQIRRNRFRDQLISRRNDDFHWDRLRYPLYYRKRHLLSPYSLLIGVSVACLILSWFSRPGFIFGFTVLAFGALIYFYTKQVASSLLIKRVTPLQALELSQFKVEYEISNRGPFTAYRLFIIDQFSGSKMATRRIEVTESLGPTDTVRVNDQLLCNAGMGLHQFTPLRLLVSDPLGLFEFEIYDDAVNEVFVYPRIKDISKLAITGSKYSLQYGIHDVSERGASTNFMRVREYVAGDPIKQISWRLSFRHQKLMVKEFEQIVNAEISILLDMDAHLHAGAGADSTWEYARKATLSIANQQIALGNSLQVLSQAGYLPFGRGLAHFNYLAATMCRFIPEKSSRDLVELYWDIIPAGSTVFYIGPTFLPERSATLKRIAALRAREIQVICVFFDGPSFLKKKLFTKVLDFAEVEIKEALGNQKKLVRELGHFGVQAVVIESGEELGKGFIPLEAA